MNGSTESGPTEFWTRLRRRKGAQWVLVYVAGAWGFLQGLEYVSETFHWPEQIRQLAFRRARLAARPKDAPLELKASGT